MKALLNVIILALSTNAMAGLDVNLLRDMTLTLIDRENEQIEACGYDINNKRRCEILGGFMLKDIGLKGSYSYQVFEIDDAGIYSRLADFASINTDESLEPSEELICELEWYSYKYTLEERISDLTLGVIVRNKDDLFIKCERAN